MGPRAGKYLHDTQMWSFELAHRIEHDRCLINEVVPVCPVSVDSGQQVNLAVVERSRCSLSGQAKHLKLLGVGKGLIYERIDGGACLRGGDGTEAFDTLSSNLPLTSPELDHILHDRAREGPGGNSANGQDRVACHQTGRSQQATEG